LTDQKGKRIRIFVPVKGEKKELLEMAHENAEQYLLEKDETTLLFDMNHDTAACS
jgi:excinuclease UvrABC nuclease subunit